jgi:hypothetical protein
MNPKIARALVEDLKRKGSHEGRLEFHDDDYNYVVEVTATKIVRKFSSVSEDRRGAFISAGAPGSPCGCCGGSGRAS